LGWTLIDSSDSPRKRKVRLHRSKKDAGRRGKKGYSSRKNRRFATTKRREEKRGRLSHRAFKVCRTELCASPASSAGWVEADAWEARPAREGCSLRHEQRGLREGKSVSKIF